MYPVILKLSGFSINIVCLKSIVELYHPNFISNKALYSSCGRLDGVTSPFNDTLDISSKENEVGIGPPEEISVAYKCQPSSIYA